MTEQEKAFFEKIEEASKKDPFVKVQAASDYISGFLSNAYKTPQGIRGDHLCYILACLTGVAVGQAAKSGFVNDLINGNSGFMMMPNTKLETDAGIFYVGDSINKYLYNDPKSAVNIICTIYGKKKGNDNIPDLQKIMENSAKKMGNKEARIWDGQHNPYEELPMALDMAKNVFDRLEPYKLDLGERVSAFALSLANVIAQVEGIFPKELNCLEMSLDTVMYLSHMDV